MFKQSPRLLSQCFQGVVKLPNSFRRPPRLRCADDPVLWHLVSFGFSSGHHHPWTSTMALDSARQLLNELMGRSRDLDPAERSSTQTQWNDPRVCRLFLAKFCPNQLFTNTKADIGACSKIHDDFVKEAYEKNASRSQKQEFEDEFIRFCQNTLQDVERRIKRARNRLAGSHKDREDELVTPGLVFSDEITEKMNSLTEQINTLLERIEEMGTEGRVEEAQEAMKEVEKLKEMKSAVKRDNLPTHWIQQRAEMGAAQEKQMEVCDVCGAFLIVNDVQQRVDDHLMGKQHVGFGKLKIALDEVMERRNKEESSRRRSSRDETPHDSNGQKTRANDDRRHRERDRRDRRSPHRDRDRHRSHRPERSRSRDRDSKSKSRRCSDESRTRRRD